MNATDADRRRIDEILTARARELARPLAAIHTVATVDIVQFSVATDVYAVESAYVYRFEQLVHVTRLPGAPPQFAGVTNLHGAIVPLVDLRALLGAPPTAAPAFAVVLGDGRAELGIIADQLLEIRALPLDELGTPIEPRPLVRRVLADGCALIDGTALLADPRLVAGDPAPVPTPKENTR